jgi:sigma-B regulation protein RsbU (phosphoserine phosphatase)
MWTAYNLTTLALVVALFALYLLWSQIRSHRLRSRLKELQTEETRVFDFLHGIGAAFSEGVRSSELHRLIVESAMRIVNADHGALYIADKSGSSLTPSHLSEGCPAFFEVPAELLAQTKGSPSLLQGLLGIQPVLPESRGPLADCWRANEVRIIPQFDTGKNVSCPAILGPLVYRNKILGVLALAGHGNRPFEDKHLAVFRTIAEQSAFALYNEAIYLAAGQKKLLDRDLEIARDIQRVLFPDADPVFSGYDISGLSLAAGQLSGDYFDFIPLGSDRLAVVIADVSGKGVPASLIMAMCRGVLRREALDATMPGDVLRRVNSLLYPDIKEDMFISMAYAILDGPDGKFLLARAGHDAPLLYRAASRKVETLNPKGMALGIDSGEVFNRVCADLGLVLEPGDCILLYTDGATEALNADGVEYGVDRLAQALEAGAAQGAAAVLRHVAEDVRAFTGRESKQDDFTLIAISKK